ncbi:MAG: MBL fold metallo-hydrolase [Myxococcota bacterium]
MLLSQGDSRVRRALLPFLILVVGVGLVVSMFQGSIAMRVMRSAIERNIAADSLESFPDGLHVVLCGAGGMLPDPTRAAACLAIIAGERIYLVDAGSSAARSLAAQGIQPVRIEAVFLTHFHSDHIDGLGELSVLRWAGGSSTTPLPVYAAEGIAQITAGLNQVYRLDAVYRTSHHGPEVMPPSGSGLAPRSFSEPAPGSSTIVFDEGGLRVSAFRVDHSPVKPAVGYRFDYKGRSLVVSGDTSKSANLERFATGVDLLIHEALSPTLMKLIGEVAEKAGNHSMEQIAGDVLTYHASPVEAAETAQSVGAKHLLYYHIVPPLPIPGLASVFLEGVSDAYGGRVTLGRDGTTISLPSGSDLVLVVSE